MEARDDTARVLQNLRDDACIEAFKETLAAALTPAWQANPAGNSQQALDDLKDAIKTNDLYLRGHPTPAGNFERLVRVVRINDLRHHEKWVRREQVRQSDLESVEAKGDDSPHADKLRRALQAFPMENATIGGGGAMFCGDSDESNQRGLADAVTLIDVYGLTHLAGYMAIVTFWFARSAGMKMHQPTTMDAWAHPPFKPAANCSQGWGVTDSISGAVPGCREVVMKPEPVRLSAAPQLLTKS